MLKHVLGMLLVAALTGCVSTKNVRIDQSNAEVMRGKSMALTTSDKPDFAAMTAGKAMFALIGAFAMISKGNEIIKTYDVPDPAVYIGQKVAEKISAANSVSITQPAFVGNVDDITTLTSTHSDSEYILDVRTINWSFGYFPADWDNYRVIYSAKLRLIDVSTKGVIAEAFCSRAPDQEPNSPTYEQLLGNNAERLKNELKLAADYCIQEFQHQIL